MNAKSAAIRYEADGIIAATGRLLVQRDILWGRHSHAWVIHDPTWPVEWKQITPFLGWQELAQENEMLHGQVEELKNELVHTRLNLLEMNQQVLI